MKELYYFAIFVAPAALASLMWRDIATDSSPGRTKPLLYSAMALTLNIGLFWLSCILDVLYLGKNPPSNASLMEHKIILAIYSISGAGAVIAVLTLILALVSKKGFARTLCLMGGGTALVLWCLVNLVGSELLNIYSLFH